MIAVAIGLVAMSGRDGRIVWCRAFSASTGPSSAGQNTLLCRLIPKNGLAPSPSALGDGPRPWPPALSLVTVGGAPAASVLVALAAEDMLLTEIHWLDCRTTLELGIHWTGLAPARWQPDGRQRPARVGPCPPDGAGRRRRPSQCIRACLVQTASRSRFSAARRAPSARGRSAGSRARMRFGSAFIGCAHVAHCSSAVDGVPASTRWRAGTGRRTHWQSKMCVSTLCISR